MFLQSVPKLPTCPLDDLRRLGVASGHHRGMGSRSRSDSRTGSLRGVDQSGLGALEDVVDEEGTRWRCFSTGDSPQESRVNMSVLEPFLRVLSHGGTTRCSSASPEVLSFNVCDRLFSNI